MRKLWFAHLVCALVVFPGDFGTLDELTEILTLAQTRKLERPIPVILYGTSYWNEIINFEALVRHGMIDRKDLGLFQYADDPTIALSLLQSTLQADLRIRSGRHSALTEPRSPIGTVSTACDPSKSPPIECYRCGSGTVPGPTVSDYAKSPIQNNFS